MSAYGKVLTLVDLAAGSERVATAGRDMAAAGGSVTLLHVVEFVPVEPMGESVMPTVEIEQELVERSRTKLAALAAQVGLPASCCRVEAGNTKAEILRVAGEEHTDLIVVGSRERHGLAILVNFTEDAVLHGAPCDVLAIRLK